MQRSGRGSKQCVAASTPPPPAIGLYSRLPAMGLPKRSATKLRVTLRKSYFVPKSPSGNISRNFKKTPGIHEQTLGRAAALQHYQFIVVPRTGLQFEACLSGSFPSTRTRGAT